MGYRVYCDICEKNITNAKAYPFALGYADGDSIRQNTIVLCEDCKYSLEYEVKQLYEKVRKLQTDG